VLLSANGELLTRAEQLQAKLGKSNKSLAVLVQRDNSRLFIPIHLG
jgi:serine protease Do